MIYVYVVASPHEQQLLTPENLDLMLIGEFTSFNGTISSGHDDCESAEKNGEHLATTNHRMSKDGYVVLGLDIAELELNQGTYYDITPEIQKLVPYIKEIHYHNTESELLSLDDTGTPGSSSVPT